jgi:cobalt/nickel transport system ATP-binding protein
MLSQTPQQNSPWIRLENVSFDYGVDRPVLAGCDFQLRPAERVALCGANGSGKSTLLHLIVGLLRPKSGSVEVFGRLRQVEHDFLEVRRRVGFLFQDSDDQLFCPTVAEDVAFGPLNLDLPRDQVRERVAETLDAVGLNGFENRITYKLSGGEKRLVALATVLAMQPDVLLLDEPTSGLDAQATERLMTLFAKLPQAIIVVSHDPNVCRRIATNTVELRNGKIFAQS